MKGMRMRIYKAIALVLAPAAFLAFGLSVATAADHLYVGHSKCKSCHKKEAIGNQYGKWQDMKHAKAFEALGTDDAKKVGKEHGVDDPQTSEKCLKCHLTAYGVPAAQLDASFAATAKDGVQCESCHGPGKDYKKKKTMMDRDKAVAAGLIVPDEKTCTTCHNDKSPTWDKAKGFDFEKAKKDIDHSVPEGYDAGGDKDSEE